MESRGGRFDATVRTSKRGSGPAIDCSAELNSNADTFEGAHLAEYLGEKPTLVLEQAIQKKFLRFRWNWSS